MMASSAKEDGNTSQGSETTMKGLDVMKYMFGVTSTFDQEFYTTNLEDEHMKLVQPASAFPHQYLQDSFSFHDLPVPELGKVIGVVGPHRIGKTTALKILGGQLKPNLGLFDPPDWECIMAHFRKSQPAVYKFLTHVKEQKLKVVMKPQDLRSFQKNVRPGFSVSFLLADCHERHMAHHKVFDELDLKDLLDGYPEDFSDEQLQRVAIAAIAMQKADVYIFDEVSTFLDLKQRHKAAQAIRSVCRPDSYVLVVDADLSLLDFIADSFCPLGGESGVTGHMKFPYPWGNDITLQMLMSDLREEDCRFRSRREDPISPSGLSSTFGYPSMERLLASSTSDLTLNIEIGSFSSPEIIVVLGESKLEKSFYLHYLEGMHRHGISKQGDKEIWDAYMTEETKVRYLLKYHMYQEASDAYFQDNVMAPFHILEMKDKLVASLSDVEKQLVSIVLTLGKAADVYIFDEPSAHLDVKQRVKVAQVIRRYIREKRKIAIIVESDIAMATYIADRAVVVERQTNVDCKFTSPMPLELAVKKLVEIEQMNAVKNEDCFLNTR